MPPDQSCPAALARQPGCQTEVTLLRSRGGHRDELGPPWRPPWPAEQALHHSLTVLGLGLLFWVLRRRPLPRSSFLLVLAFLALHTVAARWLYSAVPYDEWTHALFGVRLSDALGWQRNHFDRLVHLAYGLCLGPVLCRYFREALRWPAVWAALGAITLVTGTGAFWRI